MAPLGTTTRTAWKRILVPGSPWATVAHLRRKAAMKENGALVRQIEKKRSSKATKTGKGSTKKEIGKSAVSLSSSHQGKEVAKEIKEIESKFTSLTNDHRVLKRKFDNLKRENESKANQLTSNNDKNNDLLQRLQIAENALQIERRRLDKEKRDMENRVKQKLQALEKRQVEVEAELNHDRTSMTQSAVKIEADLRADLAAANIKSFLLS